MIKCMECGFETNKLQWTHFKYKCTGRFNNGKEYLAVYPEAKLTDESLKKQYAITEQNLVKKYGQIEGKLRWAQYRLKQAQSNLFEYKQEKYGWTKEKFDEYNSSRAQTLEKMIERYGEEHGTIKWNAYCERQAFTNTKSYFTEKYGDELGTSRYIALNKSKAVNDPKLIASQMGISLDEAVDLIITRQTANKLGSVWGSNLEKEFTTMLIEKIGVLDYTTFTRPFGKWAHLLNTYVIFDIKHADFVIEFNGDYWHANPKIYKDDAVIRGKTARDIQHRDELKKQTALNLGFRILTIWESDFKLNKQETIQKVVEWVQSGQQ